LSPAKTRWAGLLLRAAPIAFLVWFYGDAFRTWFQQDDFAWLQLRQSLHSSSDWLRAMFTPFAQGTIRPISERLFFIWGAEFFFLDPRPMHIVVATTQAASLLLLFSLVLRLVANPIAASLACFAWLCAAGLATPMSWLSTYNQVLIAFVFLAGLRSFIAAADTGRLRWLLLCWAIFLAGFGVLELNVVFPALLTAWALLYRRPLWKTALPFWLVSVAYAVAHSLWAAKPAEGVYARHWDLSLPLTYLRYWGSALAGGQIIYEWNWPAAAWVWAACGIAAIALPILLLRRREPESKAALLGAIWFSAVLGPVLPLRDHFSDYYIASAFPGLALLLAALAAIAWRSGAAARAALALILIAHIGLNAPLNREVTRWRRERGQRIRVLVEGLERAIQLHPGHTIFVSGLDRDLFWSAFADKPFVLFGTLQVYLLPGEEKTIGDEPDLGSMAQYIAPPSLIARTLEAGQGSVYRFEETALRNVTRRTLVSMPKQWAASTPSFIDAGQPAWTSDLQDGWYPAEPNGIRWMKRSASLRLAPTRPGATELFLSGYCPTTHLDQPISLTVWLGQTRLGEITLNRRNSSFENVFPVRPHLAAEPVVTLRLEASRSISIPGETRELSFAFGRIGFRHSRQPLP
jgi:hypothetical protein